MSSNNAATAGEQEHSFRTYFLQELRCALLRAKLMENDITAIALAVNAGLLSPEQASEELAYVGALRVVGTERST